MPVSIYVQKKPLNEMNDGLKMKYFQREWYKFYMEREIEKSASV
jgi:hypothetical protein